MEATWGSTPFGTVRTALHLGEVPPLTPKGQPQGKMKSLQIIGNFIRWTCEPKSAFHITFRVILPFAPFFVEPKKKRYFAVDLVSTDLATRCRNPIEWGQNQWEGSNWRVKHSRFSYILITQLWGKYCFFHWCRTVWITQLPRKKRQLPNSQYFGKPSLRVFQTRSTTGFFCAAFCEPTVFKLVMNSGFGRCAFCWKTWNVGEKMLWLKRKYLFQSPFFSHYPSQISWKNSFSLLGMIQSVALYLTNKTQSSEKSCAVSSSTSQDRQEPQSQEKICCGKFDSP